MEKMGDQGKTKGVMVSICCLTYNHEAYVRQTLEGFVNQRTNFQFEVLIHDDASTDGTARIIREYEARYPELIRPILQTENQYSKGLTNVSGTWNFPRARGKYIAMCEGDDYWTDETKLQRQVDYIEAHDGCALTFHSAKIALEGRAFTERTMRPAKKSRIFSPEEIIDKTSGFPTASLMFRTEMVQNLPEFYVKAPIADIPLQLLSAARGYGYYMDRPMCVYRLGGSSSWTEMMKKGNYEEKQRAYREEMRRMYQGYDEFTGRRFHGAVERAFRRLVFLTWVNTKKYDRVLDPKYRRFYRELNPRTRFFIRLEVKAPGVYKKLQEMFHGKRG